MRMAIFADNLRYVSLLNKIDSHATYGITSFADLTAEEFAQRHLGVNNAEVTDDEACDVPTDAQIASIPKSHDWRTAGDYIAPVQDQGSCGSCWAFATVAATEAAWAISGNRLVKLSEQQVVDCDTFNAGCDGGNMYPAEGYIQRTGLTSEDAYPYKGVQGKCKTGLEIVARITSHCFIKQASSDEETENIMRYHLYHSGPVVVGINANKAQFYNSGIMDETNCNPRGVNHAVLAVGYDVSNATPYWTIRNSWSATWGESG